MIIRALDPRSVKELGSAASGDIYRINDKGNLERIKSTLNPSVVREFFVPLMAMYISRRREIYAPSWTAAKQQIKSFIESGSTSEIPKPFDVEDRYVTRSNNSKEWNLAKRDPTLIVVSPYDIGKITVRGLPGKKETLITPDYLTTGITFELVEAARVQTGPAKGMIQSGGYYMYPKSSVMTVSWERVDQKWVKPHFDPDIAKKIGSKMREHFCIDQGLVTSTVAGADKACLDVLTAIAEIPATVKSILLGLRLVGDGYSSARKREMSLTKAHKKQADRALKRHQSSIVELDMRIKNSHTQRERRHWKRKKEQLQKSFIRTHNSAAAELVSAIASVWMNWRYNIMPNVLTIKNLIDLMDSYLAMFRTARDKLLGSFQIELEGWTGSIDVDLRHTCVIKRLIDPNVRLASLTQANVAVTAFELARKSFVLDWFINIGDLLSALTSPNLSLREGATYSWKTQGQHTLSNEDGTSLIVDYQLFSRTVINPQSHIGVSLNSTLSLFRQLDALALAWDPIRKLLIKSKRI